MSEVKEQTQDRKPIELPSVEVVQEELAKAESMDDFFGRDGIFGVYPVLWTRS